MTGQPGKQIGPYTIDRELGRGGMGVVYLGHDTRLDRAVALKSLPDHLARDPQLLTRFEGEARTLAQLSHPNVGGIHGVEIDGDARYLVLEFIDGENLADRLQRGPLPWDEAVEIAQQIASGVGAAHESGVIHRDLKPGNVLVTPDGEAKVVDFGLARVEDGPAGTPGDSDTTVMSPPPGATPTQPGAVLGTTAYMSPEQARGRRVDRRTDIWSFGVTLYEMLTGTNPFAADNVSDSIGAILHGEPDLERLPPPARPVVDRCLQRDRSLRYHDIRDAALDLARGMHEVPVSTRRRHSRLPVAIAFVLGTGLAAGFFGLVRDGSAPAPEPVRRFGIVVPDMQLDVFMSLAISPDAEHLVMRAQDGEGGAQMLFLRRLDSMELRRIEGSEGGWLPFFSPDGREVAFYNIGQLMVAGVDGVTARPVNALPTSYTGGAWLDDGSIVFTSSDSGVLHRLAQPESRPETLEIHGDEEEFLLVTPSRLPGRNAILCGVVRSETFDIGLVDLDEGRVRILARNGAQPMWAASGHVIYQQPDGPLMALPFDPDRLEATGSPFSTGTQTDARMSFQGQLFAVADDGTLAFMPPSGEGRTLNEILWVDRDGREETIAGMDRTVDLPRISHDGTRIAYRVPAPNCDIWIHDLVRGTTSRLTHEGDNHGVAWSADDRHLFTVRRHNVGGGVLKLRADGVGEPVYLSPVDNALVGWSADPLEGTDQLLLVNQNETNGWDILRVDGPSQELVPLLTSRWGEYSPRISPDGRLLAYVSDESGRPEVYIRPFPALDSKTLVSVAGGAEPVWAPDGTALYFRNGSALFSVPIDGTDRVRAGRPIELFRGNYVGESGAMAGYDVAPDGKRFVMVRRAERPATEADIEIITGWFGTYSGRN